MNEWMNLSISYYRENEEHIMPLDVKDIKRAHDIKIFKI